MHTGMIRKQGEADEYARMLADENYVSHPEEEYGWRGWLWGLLTLLVTVIWIILWLGLGAIPVH